MNNPCSGQTKSELLILTSQARGRSIFAFYQLPFAQTQTPGAAPVWCTLHSTYIICITSTPAFAKLMFARDRSGAIQIWKHIEKFHQISFEQLFKSCFAFQVLPCRSSSSITFSIWFFGLLLAIRSPTVCRTHLACPLLNLVWLIMLTCLIDVLFQCMTTALGYATPTAPIVCSCSETSFFKNFCNESLKFARRSGLLQSTSAEEILFLLWSLGFAISRLPLDILNSQGVSCMVLPLSLLLLRRQQFCLFYHFAVTQTTGVCPLLEEFSTMIIHLTVITEQNKSL